MFSIIRSAIAGIALLFVLENSLIAQNIAQQSDFQHLQKDANAVIRQSNLRFDIKNKDAAVLRVERTITILNEEGDKHALLAIEYDQYSTVAQAMYQVLNTEGEMITTIDAVDMEDVSTVEGTVYGKNRVMYYQYHSNTYPYTINYSYEISYNGMLSYPTWYPQEDYRIAVEQSSFCITTPTSLPFRYKEKNILQAPSVSKNAKTLSCQWNAEQLQGIKAEPWGPSLTQLSPSVTTAPNNFNYEGYEGNMDSWLGFGRWIYQLNQDSSMLSENTIQEIRNLTAGIDKPERKVKKIYEYMQSKTQHVQLRLGMGGYQPTRAATVDELGYGDSKALSNYMIALLDLIDIPAYYTLVCAGKNAAPIDKNFPSPQFNHVIVCVPLAMDTLWLECTSQTDPTGFLGYFTSDRDVLIVDEQGGHLSRTPTYTPANNLQHRTASVSLDENGHGHATITTLYTGLQYTHIENIARQSGTLQKSLIYQKMGGIDFNLLGHQYDLLKGALPVAREVLDLQLNQYASVSNSRLLLNPNLLNRINFALPIVMQRNADITMHNAYLDIDSISFDIPKHMQLEQLPEPVSICSKFGEYEAKYIINNSKLLYVRSFKTTSGKHSAEHYDELREFYEAVSQADNVVLAFKLNI